MPIKDAEKKKAAQRRADAKRAGKRTRNWAFLVYPESAAPDWQEKLAERCIPAFISPLHDQDTWSEYDEADNPEHKAGTPKKPHYHVMLMCSSVKNQEQIEDISKPLGGTSCIKIEDVPAYARYLCHMDSRDKAHYQVDDVVQLSGADYMSVIENTNDRLVTIGEMMDWCDEQGCRSYADLLRYARSEQRTWFRALCSNATVVMREFLRSAEWTDQQRMAAEHRGKMATVEQVSKKEE
jgi:hypothetical protein